jgi:hypothetical protein
VSEKMSEKMGLRGGEIRGVSARDGYVFVRGLHVIAGEVAMRPETARALALDILGAVGFEAPPSAASSGGRWSTIREGVHVMNTGAASRDLGGGPLGGGDGDGNGGGGEP